MDWYEQTEARLPLAPYDREGPMLLELSGEAQTVDAALNFLLKLWAVVPCSTLEWVTLDGREPQPQEPVRARCLVRLSDKVLELGRDAKKGTGLVS